MAEYLTSSEVAERLGIARDTWRAYVTRGQAPTPDRRIGPLNLWRVTTIDRWQRSRRGQGWRAKKS